MINEIKQRIEQINRGEVPIAYKTTAVGIVPVEWNSVYLKDLLDFKNGINAEKEKFGSGIKLISVMDILKNKPIYYENIKGAIDIDTSTLEKYSVTYGDILFQRSSENFDDVGKSNVYLDEMQIATYSGFVIRGKKITEYIPLYLNAILKLQESRKQIIRLSAGTQHINIGQDSLSKIILNMPDLKEQKKIADILSKWDEAVSLQEHLIKNLEKQKKSLMQNLLSPKEGWKPSKLGDCIKLQNGFAFKSQDFCTKGVAIVRISNITEKKVDLNNCPHYSGAYINDEFIVKKGDVLIAMSGATTGKIGLYSYDFISYINQRVGKFILTNKVFSYEYITQLLFSTIFENKLKNILITGAQPNISSKDIENIVFVFPNLEEQKKVSKLLAYFDRYTDIQTQKLNKLKNQQKAIQQLLLTGIVRVEK